MWHLPAACGLEKLIVSFIEYFLDHMHLHRQQHSLSILLLQYLALTRESEALIGYIDLCVLYLIFIAAIMSSKYLFPYHSKYELAFDRIYILAEMRAS